MINWAHMENEELDYVSSSALLPSTPEVKPVDENDLSTLKLVQRTLQDQIKSYQTIDRLTLADKTFTVEQQLAVNKAIVSHLVELKVIVDTTIENVREKYADG